MKQLVLIRHAKTEPQSLSGLDKERNLVTKGINDAHKIATYLQSQNILPDIIISSDANRAVQTTNILNEQFNVDNSKIIWKQNLYLCAPSEIEDTIALEGLNINCNTLFVIGHNNGISEFAYEKSNKNLTQMLPTCGVAILTFNNLKSWSDIYSTKAKIITTIIPKNI